MPTSEIVGIDPSQAFIAYAQKNAKSTRAQFEVGDAQALKFKDASFDQTLALLVMNFIPDHNKAIAEMRRVTRPQGTVSACVWDYDAGMQMLRFFWDEAIALDPAIEPKDERHMKLSHQGQLGDLWKKAGLVNVQEAPLVIDQAFSSFNDYWEPFTKGAGPGGALRRVALAGPPPAARGSHAQAVARRSSGRPVHADGESLVRVLPKKRRARTLLECWLSGVALLLAQSREP